MDKLLILTDSTTDSEVSTPDVMEDVLQHLDPSLETDRGGIDLEGGVSLLRRLSLQSLQEEELRRRHYARILREEEKRRHHYSQDIRGYITQHDHQPFIVASDAFTDYDAWMDSTQKYLIYVEN